MRIVLLGPPGSGKSVLAEKLSRKYKLPILNMHRILSSMANEETELGRLIGELLLACAPIPEELVFSALKEPFEDAKTGFILDDFPRELVHAEMLHQLLQSLGAPLELVIAIHVTNDDIMERLVGQSHCNACGEDYNIYSNPPLVEGVCDLCGGRISRRPADYEEGISNRLRVCEVNQNELVSRYREEGVLQELHGLANEPSAYQAACKLVEAAPRIPLTDPEVLRLRAESEAKNKKRGAKKSVRKRRVTKKKASARKSVDTKKAAVKKRSAVKKKTVAKKVVVKKAAVAKKKSVVKKAAAKKKAAVKSAVVKKRAASKKKVIVKKAVAKKATSKKKVAAKKKSAVKKKAATRKKAAVKKKTVVKKPLAKRRATTRKKPVAKKKASKKKSAGKRR